MSSTVLLAAMLAACNTDTTEPANPEIEITNEQSQTETTETETTAVKQPVTESTSTPEKAATTSSSEQQTTNAALSFTSNEKQITEETITSTSAELGYSIEHFANYALEAEEPGIDHLINMDDSNLSMRIQLFDTAETNFENVKAKTVETMSATATDGNYTELDLTVIKQQSAIKNIVGYETFFDNDKVSMISFENNGKLVTLTIYDTTEADLTDAFLQMGITIK